MITLQIPKSYTKEEVASLLKISNQTLERRIKSGLITPIKEGKFVRFPESEIRAYLQRRQSNKSNLQTA